jgi:Flp pilus assembly protein TadB
MTRSGFLGGTAALLAALLLAGPAAVADSGTVAAATVRDGRLDVVFSVQDLPAGAQLDQGSVRVSIDGVSVPASVTPLSSVANPLPRRAAVLAIDTSGSMAGDGIAGARTAAETFLDQVPADVLIGLVAFSDSARTLVPPTADRATVRAAIRSLGAAGDTALYDAIALGVSNLGSSGERSLVVLSDGADTSSRVTQAAATAAVKTSGARLGLVAFRTSGAQTAVLTQMSTATGGRVLPASGAGELAAAFSAAARSFDTKVALSAALPEGVDTGNHELAVSMQFGGLTTADSATFTVPEAAVTAGGRSTAEKQPIASTAAPLALLALVFLALLSLAGAVILPLNEGTAARRRKQLEYYTLKGSRVEPAPTGDEPTHGAVATSVLQFSSRVVERRGMAERMSLQLDRAGMSLRPHEWLIVRTSIVLAAVALLSLLLSNLLFAILGGTLLGWVGTREYVRFKSNRRLKAFESELPDALQLVASSLQTGFSLQQALDAAVQDGREPMSGELGRALAEARLGAVLEDALDRVGERMDNQDFRWTVMAIRIQRQVGGNLSEVLQTTVATLRERAAMRRQVRALSAEGRLSAYILIALPITLFLWMFFVRREYISLLWTTPLGLVMIGGALLLVVIGAFWMRKVIRVEV